MRILILSLSLLAAFAGSASAKVFGLKAGEPLDRITGATATGGEEPFEFAIEPPEPDPAFSTYKAIIYPETGLCSISAYAPASAASGLDGARDAMGQHAEIGAALDKTYGKSVDEMYGGGDGTSIEEDLLANEANVIRIWGRDSHTLPAELSRVALFAQSEEGIPRVFLAYEFNNEEACMTARNTAIDAAAAAE